MRKRRRKNPTQDRPAGKLGRVGRWLRWLVTLRGSPEAVAGGFAIGMFVAFTPTIGFQLILAPFLATIFKANRPASLIPIWISNAVTMAPLYAFTYWVGEIFWSGPPVSEVYQTLKKLAAKLGSMDFWEIWDQFMLALTMTKDILVPLWIGGILVGSIAGGVVYLVVVGIVRRARRIMIEHRQRRRRARGDREATPSPQEDAA